ncbi:hypothetical protein [Cryptosporangium sp. NPDC051539]|uniref:hypothetical protein n=1 Tax=Cryptosporangium sp. NPDC051539 TaxID=3363962 RepID=UPI0037A88538
MKRAAGVIAVGALLGVAGFVVGAVGLAKADSLASIGSFFVGVIGVLIAALGVIGQGSGKRKDPPAGGVTFGTVNAQQVNHVDRSVLNTTFSNNPPAGTTGDGRPGPRRWWTRSSSNR